MQRGHNRNAMAGESLGAQVPAALCSFANSALTGRAGGTSRALGVKKCVAGLQRVANAQRGCLADRKSFGPFGTAWGWAAAKATTSRSTPKSRSAAHKLLSALDRRSGNYANRSDLLAVPKGLAFTGFTIAMRSSIVLRRTLVHAVACPGRDHRTQLAPPRTTSRKGQLNLIPLTGPLLASRARSLTGNQKAKKPLENIAIDASQGFLMPALVPPQGLSQKHV